MKKLKEEVMLRAVKTVLSESNQNVDIMKNLFLPFDESNLIEYFKQFYIEIGISEFSFNNMHSNQLNIIITNENEIMVISSFDENTFVVAGRKKREKKRWVDYEIKKVLYVIDIKTSNLSNNKNTFLFKEIYQQLKMNKLILISICFLILISSILVIVMSFYLEVIFDLVVVNYLFSYLWPMTFFCFCIIFLVGGLYFCTEKILSKYVTSIVNRKKTVMLEEANGEVKKEYLTRISIFLNSMPTSIFSVAIKWIASIPLLSLGVLLFNYNSNLFIICVLIGTLNILVGIGFSSYFKNRYKFSFIRYVDEFIKDNLESSKNKGNATNQKELLNEMLFLDKFIKFFLVASTLLLFAYLTRMVLLDIISIGIVFIYLAIAITFLIPFILFGKFYIEGSIYRSYLDIYNSLFKHSQHKKTVFWNNDKISTLRLQNAKLEYYGGSSVINMHIEFSESELISIVGRNNSGKSNLANLLTNKSSAVAQMIFYNEVDLCNLVDSKEFEKKIVLLKSDEGFRYGESILDNLTQGENYAEKDINDACKEACILEFINKLPNKFQTIVKNETQLSKTEKKLICLAATLLNEAEVIIFDSFFEQFDSNKERVILKNLKRVPGIKVVFSNQNSHDDLFDNKFLLKNGTLQKRKGVSKV
ncbi:ATP-binding cassette domain-containing protein [Listeria seeligeri]|uniref:ATP-binding cassette domain-containing protein n=1 Tax=Listeria seeligeri TaxID=1640 RepID=UPI001624CF69|nr:ATP-binding cassette domain-containing protein [Listeria seeligeri]MBC1729928.1 ATP-binding cassette domain-containing protein [Listeria seeligeri]MBC1757985.1 ATP-binding cassette domain-containing protein [Listeria seeligeri]MBC1817306.1 ATP-binding cassette domain-containing protein [Listeria seeligeri]MBC1849539.1 ATP-binding cassette domain-containing protein [Listeria seeligeri]MBC1854854.1 ATP-binding cassette domain-containing protein [Listeria seeligeri]